MTTHYAPSPKTIKCPCCREEYWDCHEHKCLANPTKYIIGKLKSEVEKEQVSKPKCCRCGEELLNDGREFICRTCKELCHYSCCGKGNCSKGPNGKCPRCEKLKDRSNFKVFQDNSDSSYTMNVCEDCSKELTKPETAKVPPGGNIKLPETKENTPSFTPQKSALACAWSLAKALLDSGKVFPSYEEIKDITLEDFITQVAGEAGIRFIHVREDKK
jgi:hypothetical protein